VIFASGCEGGGVIKNFPGSFLLTAAGGEAKAGGKGRQSRLRRSQRCVSCVKQMAAKGCAQWSSSVLQWEGEGNDTSR